MKIIYFGAIDKKFSNNQIFWRGFVQNEVKLVDVVVDTRITPLNNDRDTGPKALISRLAAKLTVIPKVFDKWSEIKDADALFVGFPGHFDIPLAFIVSRMLGIPLVFYPVLILSVTFCDDIKMFAGPSWKLTLLTSFERLMYRLCDIVIADGPYQRDVFHREFGVPKQKLHYVYGGANDEFYKFSRAKPQKNNFNVVYYGMYTPLHGVEYILRAAKLLTRDSHVVFSMIGNGKTYEEMRALARNLKVSNVRFYPNVREPDAKPLLDKASVFLGLLADSPSVKRQIANKVYQGLALGKTVITADAPITRLALTHKKDVYLVPPANPQALVRAIRYLRSHPEFTQRVGMQARKTFEQKFTPRVVAVQIMNIIETYNKQSTLKVAI